MKKSRKSASGIFVAARSESPAKPRRGGIFVAARSEAPAKPRRGGIFVAGSPVPADIYKYAVPTGL